MFVEARCASRSDLVSSHETRGIRMVQSKCRPLSEHRGTLVGRLGTILGWQKIHSLGDVETAVESSMISTRCCKGQRNLACDGYDSIQSLGLNMVVLHIRYLCVEGWSSASPSLKTFSAAYVSKASAYFGAYQILTALPW